jgi:hypothetical protein
MRFAPIWLSEQAFIPQIGAIRRFSRSFPDVNDGAAWRSPFGADH